MKEPKEKVHLKNTLNFNQRKVMTTLLEGGLISNLGRSGVRLLDKDKKPILKINPRSFWALREVIQRDKKGFFVADKSKIRKMHGATWLKKEMKRIVKLQKLSK